MQCLGDAQRSCNHAVDRMCSLPGDVGTGPCRESCGQFNWPCGCSVDDLPWEEAALQEISRSKPNLRNKIAKEVENAVMDLAT